MRAKSHFFLLACLLIIHLMMNNSRNALINIKYTHFSQFDKKKVERPKYVCREQPFNQPIHIANHSLHSYFQLKFAFVCILRSFLATYSIPCAIVKTQKVFCKFQNFSNICPRTHRMSAICHELACALQNHPNAPAAADANVLLCVNNSALDIDSSTLKLAK